MKRLITLTSTMLLATSAFASSFVNISGEQNISAGSFDSKSAAYEAGFNLKDSMQDMSQAERKNEFATLGYSHVGDIKLDDFKVKVEEYASNREEVKYRSILNFDYQFKAKQKD
ncbi:DUF3316 domain-containing protein [Vibrio coralliilyticus]|uniref:DUF3316 domain-containing protein n=1 Tax=Vibrio coralliilyticus TaxID=190893 RepID=UPI003916CFBF